MAVKYDFKNKVVLVTGSSSGIGEECVCQFSLFGAKVVITGRNESRIKSVAEKCEQLSPHKYKPLAVVADLTNEKEVEKLVEQTVTNFGGIDILVNNAGIANGDTISSPNILSTFDKMIATNLRPVIQLCNLCLPHLQISKGCIVNVSSAAGLHPIPRLASYGIAKAGLHMLAKIIAVEYAEHGVRVNTVCPTSLKTPVYETLGLNEQQFDEMLMNQATKLPLLRCANISDVVNAILFFASDSAEFLTGHIVPIDGGLNLTTRAT
ncbi:short-chain dehydrogenease/reductase-like protein [Leptotrombidium deliense]|uniref:Short-chain dehydrogenease/reductase-like protein n=1 Tax=Leptotrombidium deliense TaxID=299467 RepID=A0A443S2M9_9ACAR|nr:short-chain dehydrogenease/reductase-like protein [Leptotrombidium deliense]